MKSPLFICLLSHLLFLILAFPRVGSGQAVQLELALINGGVRQFSFPAESTNYYILYRGSTVAGLTNPVVVAIGTVPVTTMQDTNAQAAAGFYRVRTVATNAPLDLDSDGMNDVAELIAGRDPLVPQPAGGNLVINEVDYDQIGSDSAEFVEIYNPTAGPINLAGLRLLLINGGFSPAQQYQSIDLSLAGASLAAGQYLVVKAASVVVPAGALTVNFSAANDNVQNGAPDGIAIFNTATATLIDALSYEGSITTATFTGYSGTYNLVEGTALSASAADSNTIVGSLNRLPNGTDTNNANTDWAFSTTPTPGVTNGP